MYSYEALSRAFPYKYISTRSTIRYMVRQLIDPKRCVDPTDTPDGSSFAITTDAPSGMWTLWLSEVSMNFIVEHMAHVEHNLIENDE